MVKYSKSGIRSLIQCLQRLLELLSHERTKVLSTKISFETFLGTSCTMKLAESSFEISLTEYASMELFRVLGVRARNRPERTIA